MIPLRIRVRKSAIGSVIDMARSPARLRHARDEAVVRQLAQAQAAEPELPVHRARAAAAATTRVRARLVLGRPLRGDDVGCLGPAYRMHSYRLAGQRLVGPQHRTTGERES